MENSERFFDNINLQDEASLLLQDRFLTASLAMHCPIEPEEGAIMVEAAVMTELKKVHVFQKGVRRMLGIDGDNGYVKVLATVARVIHLIGDLVRKKP